MRSRRFLQVETSDDEDEAPVKQQSSNSEENLPQQRQRKKMKLLEEEEGEEEKQEQEKNVTDGDKKNERDKEKEASQPSGDEEEDEEEEEEEEPEAKPLGEPTRVTGKGRGRRNHYEAFEFDGTRYDLSWFELPFMLLEKMCFKIGNTNEIEEDPVLLTPEDTEQKPYVAIIKDITQSKDGSMMVTGQWFYRPEEAERKGGGNWQSCDTRELFYSFHRDEVPAESVMHKCVVHFVPLHKQLPNRKQHPGFIVQKVYDTVERKLWKLTDKDYEDNKQHEIDLLVQKTMSRLGNLPDLEIEDTAVEQEDPLKNRRSFKRKSISPINVSREEEAVVRTDHNLKNETVGGCTNAASEFYSILMNSNALTGETQRDKWLEKLLQGIQLALYSSNNTQEDEKEKGTDAGSNPENRIKCEETANGSEERSLKSFKSFPWPDAAVSAVTALEKVSNEALSSDFQKYNQKMRQLYFNLKTNAVLAERLLNGELEPSKILNMSPTELKEGIMAEETATKESEEPDNMQMTDARCSRCSELKVGVRDIIQAGHGERYKLECIACGHSWYASRDEVSVLTIDAAATSVKSVGTAPWATAKFEDVEKNLVSPREPESAKDLFKKTSEAYFPVLDTQKSFNKSRKENNPESTKTAE